MREHFGREVALVEGAGISFCHCHRNEHNTLLELCDQAYELSARNVQAARTLLRKKLPRSIRDHINSMDQIAVLVIGAAEHDQLTIGPQQG
jgi:hemerythrin